MDIEEKHSVQKVPSYLNTTIDQDVSESHKEMVRVSLQSPEAYLKANDK